MNFYRYEIVEYAETGWDGEFVSPSIPNPRVELRTFSLYKETPQGYWIGYGFLGRYSRGRWVSKTTKKRYAYPSKEEAMVNFIKRTERRVKILDWQRRVGEIALSIAEKMDINADNSIKYKFKKS